jgi:hypothetical protein
MYKGYSASLYLRTQTGLTTWSSWSILGSSGNSGYSGFSGISGYSGSGVSGYSGFSGYSGVSGYSGSGVSGYSGTVAAGSITGSGTSGYITKWGSASGITSSLHLREDAEGVFIGGNLSSGAAYFHIDSDTKDDVPFKVTGTQGELFSVTDNLDSLLQSVNDITGLPVFEVYADDRVVVHGATEVVAKDAPSTPAADNARLYVTASGATPNREIALNVKFEDGTVVILSSVLV